MKKLILINSLCVLALVCGAARDASAQGKPVLQQRKPTQGNDPSTLRDTDIDTDSRHNLDVARQYFKLKKAYYAARDRCKEVIDVNPGFAKIDEILYIAGMSDFYLSNNQGKQKLDAIPEKKRLTSEEYRKEAREYLSKLVSEHPDSDFSKQAQDTLRNLGGALPKDSKQ